VGDLLYADTTTSLAKLADVAVGNALISGGVAAAPSWGKIGLATHVDGTLPIANGGTGNTSGTATNLSGGTVSATTGTFSGTMSTAQINSQAQVRATGWYGTNSGSYTGLGVEMGVSGGQGYVLCYNRDTAAYNILNFNATSFRFDSTVRVSSGGSLPLELTTSSSSPWSIALTRSDLGLTSQVYNSNGTTWYFQHRPSFAGNTPLDSGNYTSFAATNVNIMRSFAAPGTWTKPAGLKSVKVTVVGAGGNGGPGSVPFQSGGGGGAGGTSIRIYPAASLPGPQPYTVGANPGGSAAFGAAPIGPISATGGTNGGVIGRGSGGAGSGGDYNNSGGVGGRGLNGSYFGGIGGSSSQGGGTSSRGAGGEGASANPGAGTPGPGVPGVIIFEEYY
jgi:hypothetical protein